MFLIIKKCKETDISIFENFSEHIYTLHEIEDFPIKLDIYKFILILGGDGTILRFLQLYKQVPPIIAINYGTVGFLTSFSKLDFKNTVNIKKLFDIKNMFTTYRNRLLLSNEIYFLNEAVFTTRKRRLNTFKINIKDKCKDLIIKGDSLLVSTMTGSTAYNHSALGPTLINDDVFIINVITPNKNMFRPIICGLYDQIEVFCDEKDDTICVVDGKEHKMSSFSIKYDGNQVRFLNEKKENTSEGIIKLMMNK